MARFCPASKTPGCGPDRLHGTAQIGMLQGQNEFSHAILAGDRKSFDGCTAIRALRMISGRVFPAWRVRKHCHGKAPCGHNPAGACDSDWAENSCRAFSTFGGVISRDRRFGRTPSPRHMLVLHISVYVKNPFASRHPFCI